jgi:lysophospholipase L1-like esterase
MIIDMKKIKSIILLVGFLFAAGCEQEVITTVDPCVADPSSCEEPTPTAGTANFSKYVAIGTSISAGFQAGALFTDGQNESLGAILANQFAGVNSGAAFNQPTIGSVNGYNASFSSPPSLILGRMILFDPDGPSGPKSAGPAPSAKPLSPIACTDPIQYTAAVPAPYNTADLPGAFTGNKATLNNFSVPGIIAYQLTQASTGGPNSPANPLFNGLYARFASNPGTSTILTDAIGAAPTFFTFEVGFNEAVGYAARGASGTNLLTAPYDPATFGAVINGAVGALLGTPPATNKGVIANVPDVTKLPHFSLVAWNSIAFAPGDPTIAAVNTAYGAYNAGLDQVLALGVVPGLTADEVAKRKIQFVAGKNGIVILDESLTNLTGVNPALVSMRMATAADKITLGAGAILGTRADCSNPSSVYGVGVPLADQYTLTASEIVDIQTAITGYNNAINTLVAANATRLAKADLYSAYNQWVSAPNATILASGIPIVAGITPPLAGFSEDGVHPNGKGTAVFANVFIDAINTTFGASLNKANITKYKGTRTPINGVAP